MVEKVGPGITHNPDPLSDPYQMVSLVSDVGLETPDLHWSGTLSI